MSVPVQLGVGRTLMCVIPKVVFVFIIPCEKTTVGLTYINLLAVWACEFVNS